MGRTVDLAGDADAPSKEVAPKGTAAEGERVASLSSSVMQTTTSTVSYLAKTTMGLKLNSSSNGHATSSNGVASNGNDNARATSSSQNGSGSVHSVLEPPPLDEPRGGFIFVCNDETLQEDLDRQLFGTSLCCG